MDYDAIPYTILINFNNFFINQKRKKVFEEFYYRDDCGNKLTEKDRILNINIEECYRLWYNPDFDSLRRPKTPKPLLHKGFESFKMPKKMRTF